MVRTLKILFIIRSAEHFSRYDSIIRTLCLAGHRLTALFDKDWSDERDIVIVNGFKNSVPNFGFGWLINRKDSWVKFIFTVRSLLTYRRFLIIKEQSSFFKDRWKSYLPFWLRAAVSLPSAQFFLKTEVAHKFLNYCENRIPADAKITAQIKNYNPDIVISPVGGIRVVSPNTEYLKAAQYLKIPNASPLISWDTLTTKGLITVIPELFLVWNETHKEEAMRHHHVPAENIRIIGAPVFDKWFPASPSAQNGSLGGSGLKPSVPWPEFCRRHGLNKSAPYILYLGSAKGTAKDETWLIRALRQKLDVAADPALRDLQIVVRPHPANAGIYQDFALDKIVIIPKGGALPDTRESLQLSYDTYFYAKAVLGVFTSAMMEAIIVGRPIIIVVSEEYKKTQTEAEHFRQFIASGAITVTHNLDESIMAVQSLLTGHDALKPARENFVRNYIRPRGLETPAGVNALREIENFVASRKNHKS